MRPRSRNTAEKLERRDAILAAAETAFCLHGFEKTSMDQIAKSAKLSRSLLYVYFTDKDDIHIALCSRALNSLYERKVAAMANCQTGVQKLRATGYAYYDFYRDEPNSFKTLCLRMSMLGEAGGITQGQASGLLELQSLEEKIMGLMAGAIDDGIADGSVDKSQVTDSLQTAMFMRGSLHGVIMLQDASGSQLFDRADIERDALIEYGIAFVVGSLSLPSC